jgi:hypothetical protein
VETWGIFPPALGDLLAEPPDAGFHELVRSRWPDAVREARAGAPA